MTTTHLWMMTAMSRRKDISIALIVLLTIAIASIVLYIFKDTEDTYETVQEMPVGKREKGIDKVYI